MIRGIHHVALSTSDIERLTKFYEDAFGFEVVWHGGWPQGSEMIDTIVGVPGSSSKQVMMKAGNAHIEIFQYLTPEGKPIDPKRPANDHGYTHFCLQVTDIQAEYERLQKAGMRFHAPPQNMETCHATYGRDPFGNVIEIYEIHSNALAALPGSR